MKDVIKIEDLKKEFKLNEIQFQVLSDYIAKDYTPTELAFCMGIAKKAGIDPLNKQVYFQKRYNNVKEVIDGQEVWTKKANLVVITGIDGYRSIAARNGLAGMDEPIIKQKANSLYPESATVTVYRMVDCGEGKKERVPYTATAYWDEYVVKHIKKDYQTKKEVEVIGEMWKKMPKNQLAKCAEALALRKAFSQDLSGLYTEDEMAQADNGKIIQVEDDLKNETQEAPKKVKVDVLNCDIEELKTSNINFYKWCKFIKERSDNAEISEILKMFIKLSKSSLFSEIEKQRAEIEVVKYLSAKDINDMYFEFSDNSDVLDNLLKNYAGSDTESVEFDTEEVQ